MQMHGASRASLAAAQQNLGRLVADPDVDVVRVSEDLFDVAKLVFTNPPVRAALTDATRSADDRSRLATDLLRDRVSAPVFDLVVDMVRYRWSVVGDLVRALTNLAVQATAVRAERAGRLDSVEDELFRFQRIVAGNVDLRRALNDVAVPPEQRAHLVELLLTGKVGPETLRLARRSARRPTGLSCERTLLAFLDTITVFRSQLVAHVVAAAPLADGQLERLAAVLSRMYGHPVHLDVQVDPTVVGGLLIEVGGQVLDGSLARRLERARQSFAG